uniref:Gastric triacylglycerol lipase n=1 Tax=Aceria tosichella TaxID=561515 RepID=A0A6G1S4L0_9ACAR
MSTKLRPLGPRSILIILLGQFASIAAATQQKPHETAKVLTDCGFIAREYEYVSQDSVMLSIVRGTNPLFNGGEHGLDNKQPIIFLQGTTLGSSLALENSQNVKPRDFSHLDVNDHSRAQLIQEIGSDPSARNFLFLALNFGHEVWILNRRGFSGSRRRLKDKNRTLADAMRAVPDTIFGFKYIGDPALTGGLISGRPRAKRSLPGFDANAWLTDEMTRLLNQSSKIQDKARALFAPLSLVKMPEGMLLFTDEQFQQEFIETFNPDFWNFSLDEQAKYDLPATIDFVLEKTGKKKVHLVGLSCGGAIILLAHAENPKLAEKVGASVLWAPSVNLGSGSDIVFQLSYIVPFTQGIVGPLPALFLNRPLQTIFQRYCKSSPQALRTCNLMYDSAYGRGASQSTLGPIWWTNTFVSSPSNELKHLGQMAHTNLTCKFNYNTPKKNLEVYGQPSAPCYNFSRIETPNLFFYVSDDDRLVSVEDIDATLEQLSVSYHLEHISEEGLHFSHLGYIVHKQNTRVAVVPTLKNIASVEAKDALN